MFKTFFKKLVNKKPIAKPRIVKVISTYLNKGVVTVKRNPEIGDFNLKLYNELEANIKNLNLSENQFLYAKDTDKYFVFRDCQLFELVFKKYNNI